VGAGVAKGVPVERAAVSGPCFPELIIRSLTRVQRLAL